MKFDLEKIQARLERLKFEKARDIYESANFNFELFEYSLKEYFKKRNDAEEKRK